ncbi:MAG: Rho termination factor N-terminal domain-containing protein, partial [Treponema sp.]|nr:Rho termination factor N-terminal domain-containing protein [Treponema sp.]
MALMRRGRKPKIEENDETLNSAAQESADTDSGLSENRDSQENLSSENSFDNGEKAPRVLVRAKPRRPGGENPSTEYRRGRPYGGSQGYASYGNSAHGSHNENGPGGNLPAEDDKPSSQPTEQASTFDASMTSFPKLPSMPDLYGKPEPRLDQDNGKPRLTINELIRLNMKDLRELAACYNISHEDMVAYKKQEVVFALLRAHTE